MHEPFAEHREQINLFSYAANHANLHNATVHRSGGIITGNVITSHNVENNIRAMPVGLTMNGIHEIFLFIEDGGIRPQFQAGLTMRF